MINEEIMKWVVIPCVEDCRKILDMWDVKDLDNQIKFIYLSLAWFYQFDSLPKEIQVLIVGEINRVGLQEKLQKLLLKQKLHEVRN